MQYLHTRGRQPPSAHKSGRQSPPRSRHGVAARTCGALCASPLAVPAVWTAPRRCSTATQTPVTAILRRKSVCIDPFIIMVIMLYITSRLFVMTECHDLLISTVLSSRRPTFYSGLSSLVSSVSNICWMCTFWSPMITSIHILSAFFPAFDNAWGWSRIVK